MNLSGSSSILFKIVDIFKCKSLSYITLLFFVISISIKGTVAHPVVADEQQIQTILVEHGFENVAVCTDSNALIVTYENRIFRHEVKAIREVFTLVSGILESPTSIVLIPQNRGIPLTAILLDTDTISKFFNSENNKNISYSKVRVSFATDTYWKKLKKRRHSNLSARKFDITVYPQYNVLFGNFDDPVKSQFNLAPAVSTSLWKGMSLFAQWIFPIRNELSSEGDHGRPGLLLLNQTFRLPFTAFISATTGYFSNNRYGIDFETRKYLFNGRFAIGADVGYTGYASYRKGVWYYSDIDVWTFFFNTEYRFQKFDFKVKATYGLFLDRKKGWRFDVLRQFNEVDIGFFFLTTESGYNGGFNFSIPILPSRYMPTWPLRISPAKKFPWEYRYRAYPTNGRHYKTQNSIDAYLKRLDAGYIKNRLSEDEKNNNPQFFTFKQKE